MRYLKEERPGFLRRKFSLRRDSKTIERETAVELGIDPQNFRTEIDDLVVGYFESKGIGAEQES